MQSTFGPPAFAGLHAAVILDGNGRWAERRGLPRAAGHRAGVTAVRRLVEAAPAAGIGTLTLYAFSSDNWTRPPREVQLLLRLLREHLRREVDELNANGVCLSIIGRRDRLSPPLLDAVAHATAVTARGRRLHLRLAIDYSGRDAILAAARALADNPAPTREAFARAVTDAGQGGPEVPPVDLLIRTGGEQRLSDFLPWETAYAELYFTPVMWPDFDQEDLQAALAWFRGRTRRYGGLPLATAV
ncbi:MAG TPA: di-trans,poly-cis-decaprenylcistransferase [Gemmatimonadales bacterium]|nr:di-trans,poly-cis-decaprenylcistransferase [Gemmatimonadales bacterium]